MMSIEEAGRISRDLRIFCQTLSGVATEIDKTRQTIKSVRRLIGGSGSDGLESKMIAAGAALIAFPEPIISDIAGSALIASGMLVKGIRGPTITDMFKEARKAMRVLKGFCEEL
jgi:hypothetical protein